jgi:hypothetical protein
MYGSLTDKIERTFAEFTRRIVALETEMERLVKARECADEAAKNLENELRKSIRNREELLAKAHARVFTGVAELKAGNSDVALDILYAALEVLKPYGQPA